jgi:uncharacterized ferritin-like protein (DUF455 family)
MRAPAEGTVERWAWEYVRSDRLADKLAPPAPPSVWEEAPSGSSARLAPTGPGRPPELRVHGRADKTRGLAAASGRARALHTFFHHELQAAELMAWAILAYPDAPRDFKEGLLRIALDEIRHMGLYGARIRALGYDVGSFPVRDWFWTRVPTSATPAAFCAVMGLGLESANLEHAASFAARFRQVGDEDSAKVQETVGREEIAHVRFGVRWFSRLVGQELAFDAWRAALPPPLTPLLMRGTPLCRDARRRAGQPSKFLDELEAWQPDAPGS